MSTNFFTSNPWSTFWRFYENPLAGVCVCVWERESARERVCEYVYVCVHEWVSERVSEWVSEYVCVWVSEFVCVCLYIYPESTLNKKNDIR